MRGLPWGSNSCWIDTAVEVVHCLTEWRCQRDNPPSTLVLQCAALRGQADVHQVLRAKERAWKIAASRNADLCRPGTCGEVYDLDLHLILKFDSLVRLDCPACGRSETVSIVLNQPAAWSNGPHISVRSGVTQVCQCGMYRFLTVLRNAQAIDQQFYGHEKLWSIPEAFAAGELANQQRAADGAMYNLVALVCHTGSERAGHFYCYVTFNTRDWYKYDGAGRGPDLHLVAGGLNGVKRDASCRLASAYYVRGEEPHHHE